MAPKISIKVQSKKALRKLRSLRRKYAVVMVKSLAKTISEIFNKAALRHILPKTGKSTTYIDRVGQLRTRGDASFDAAKLTGRTGRLQRALGGGMVDISNWTIPRSGRSAKLEGPSPFIFARVKSDKATTKIDYTAKFGITAKGDQGIRFRIGHEKGLKKRFGTIKSRPFLHPAFDDQNFLHEKIYKRFSERIRNVVI